MKNIILIAPPAAGKGTLSNSLSICYGYLPLSTGDMLREKAKNDESLREAMKSGMLIDDNTVFSALEEQLNKIGDSLYILDGFPRNTSQAIAYEKILNELNKELGIVILLEAPKELLMKRITGRISCPKCKAVYNSLSDHMKPVKEGICNNCGTSLVRRSDDNEETFNQRFQTYIDKTEPLINYYKEKGNLYKVDSTDKETATIMIEGLLND